MRTLYLCYFGLREPLVQTQVLPYLRQLITGGIDVSLLTFEPQLDQRWTRETLTEEQSRLAREGIEWSYLPYHKRPSLPATVYDIAAGARLALRLAGRHKIDVLHARGHVPAAMAALVKRRIGGRMIFDIRGFMSEEYTDAGVWPAGGYLYRWAKLAEKRLFAAAGAFVVLAEHARNLLFPGWADAGRAGRPVEVIPCCVDPQRFQSVESISREELRWEFKLAGRRVVVYVGALGGWYLTNEMAEFLATAHKQDATTFSLILTQSRPELITRRLDELGISEADYLVREVLPKDVPRYLKAADIAISFIKPCYSKLSSSPTKIAEYLMSGLPVISTAGIGDLDEIIKGDQVGVVIKQCTEESYRQALDEVDALRREESLAERCRVSARHRFDLEKVGGERYRRLYRRLLNSAV